MADRTLTAAQQGELAPLARTIAETVRDTPVRVGTPEGAADLIAMLTVNTAAYMGSVLPKTPGLAQHMVEVDTERQAQLAKWGDQHHPDGTSGHNFRREADAARRSCQSAAQRESVTWFHILREEFWEAMAETDPAKLRAELVQIAAVTQAWIADLDSRKADQ